MGSSAQRGQMRPQPQVQQPQRPMGGQPQQGKGPGLPMPQQPMPQQPNMGGNRPYKPVGANNGPFNPNPVQQVNQPQQVSPQLLEMQKMLQMQSGQNMGQSAPMQPRGNDSFSGSNMPQGKGPSSPMQPPQITGYPPMQPGMVPQQGKGPQSPFAMPAQTGPVQPGMYSPIYGQQNTPGLMR